MIEAERSDWQSSLGNDGYQNEALEIGASFNSQILPSIRAHPCAINVMWIPAPDWIKTFRFQIQSGF